MKRAPARAAIGLIRLYRRATAGRPRRCRYEPTCSQYAIEAVEAHGAARGLLMAAWRLARCNPFSHGGHDPVGRHG